MKSVTADVAPALVPDFASDVTPMLAARRLSVRGLGCQRGMRKLFADVDLDLGPGEIVWLRGQNGRGKTSLLRLVAGIAVPQSGEIVFGDGALAQADATHGVVYIGHANALKDDLTVSEALEFLLRIHGRPCTTSTVTEALRVWEMHSHRHALVRTLSQGQRRRVALARLVVECMSDVPGTWVLDEPFDSLDTDGVDRLNELLAQHLRRGGNVLITGHQSALDPALAQRDFDLDHFAS